MKLDKLGWVAAAGLAGAWFVMGFDGNSMKFATVDLEKVFQESDAFKQGNVQLQQYAEPRVQALQWIKNNQVIKPADALAYVTIAVDPKGDATKLTQFTNEAQTEQTKYTTAVTAQPPTDAQKQELTEFQARRQQNGELYQKKSSEFDNDIKLKETELRSSALEKVREQIKDIASKQGYTVIYNVEVAPYAQNDITAEALKAVKKS
jgi:Skp family chaperone for outer membrane proteins